MSHDNYLAYYRGELQALVCHDAWVVFVSKHYEGQATALYRFDLDGMRLHESALSCGATALAVNHKSKTLWVAAEDGYVYQTGITTGEPKALKKLPVFEQPIITMQHLAGTCILALQANALTLIDTDTQKTLQHLEFSLSDSATAIACDATGAYVVLGMQSGEVTVYEYRDQQLHCSAKADLHQGKVTALQFEPNELRFFSAGEDKKLLSTHALGELEALDRGKKKNHSGVIADIILGEKRFFTVASDKMAKSWAYEGGQPVSWQSNLHKAIAAGIVTVKESRYLLIANSDNSLRVVGVDADERFTALKQITRDGYAWAKNELQQSDPVLREKALRFLIQYDDKKAIDVLRKHWARERDKATRELMITLATQAKHPHAIRLLEDALCDRKHESVRRLAFDGLEKQAPADDLGYLSLVLQYNYEDIGRLALTKLVTLAKKQPRAEQLLLAALNHKEWCLREFALSVLETLYGKKDPKAGLQALQSRYADLQRAAMIRLFQRGLLGVTEVKRAIALLQDHTDALVRHTAFLVSILSQGKLSKILKVREKDLARQLQELEDFELLAKQPAKPSLTQKIKKTLASKHVINVSQLTHDDYVPLLQGMTSRHADICFTASFALAVLEDTRALGVLLLLSHDHDTDIRVGVCKAFAWLKQDNSIEILQNLLHDSQAAVRDAAFSALQQVQHQPLELAAVEQSDIQLRALTTLLERLEDTANTHNNDVTKKTDKALGLLKAALNSPFVTIRQPEKAEDKKRWQESVISSLQGLALLGDARAFDVVAGFLKSKNKNLVNSAATVLPMINAIEHQTELHALLKNDTLKIRAAAALALAYTAQDPEDVTVALTALADKKVKNELSRRQLLTAQVCLQQVTPQRLQRFVIAKESRLSSQLILLAYELLQQTEKPVLSLQSLAVEEPRLQGMGADLLSRYHDLEQCWTYAADWLNRSAGKESLHWAFTPEMVQQYSSIIVHAKPFIKVRFIAFLQGLDERISMEQWQQTMTAFMGRYKALTPSYQPLKRADIDQMQQRQWRELAFGAYLGRIRADESDYELAQRLQAASLRGMRYLATHDAQLKPSIESCLLTLLNHPSGLIRQTAFDDLQTLKMDLERLGNAATASPQSDIAKQGLKLLVDHYPVKKSLGLLHDLLMTGDEVLAVEAYSLLLDEEGLVKIASSALQSYTLSLRHECLSALAKQYDDEACQQHLLVAIDNDHPEVVIKAARLLARHQHPAIFAKLKKLLLQSNDEKQQKSILRALGQLKTPEVAVFLTDYLQQQKTARDLPLDVIYPIIASYRHVDVAETLLARFAKHDKEQSLLFNCLRMISGYDQPLYDHVYNSDEDETDAPPKWLEKQHPRQHSLLVRLFETLLQCKQPQRAQPLLAMLSWMPADIPDTALLKAVPIVDLAFLTPLTAVIGWRYYKRHQAAPLAKGLLTLLTHPEAEIQFLAAEALSKGGQTQGKAVLLSSIEYLDSIEYRQRAVLALGESADPQVLEILLTLAKESEHVLQAVAIEAIGHMGTNDIDDKLFKLLHIALRDSSEYSDRVVHALNGLRWLNTLSAWQLIAEKAQQDGYYYRDHAIKCLRYWDNDYSRQVLLDIIQQSDDDDIVTVALKAAKQFWQPSKNGINEVDFALLKGNCAFLDEDLVERISNHASVSELFALLSADYAIYDDPYLDDEALVEHQQMLANLRHALLQRETMTEEDIVTQLTTENVVSQSVAVQLFIRQNKLQSTTKETIDTVLQSRYKKWLELQSDITQGQPQSKQQAASFDALQALLQSLLWCSITHHIASITLVEILQQTEKEYVVLQEQSLTALLTQQQPLIAEQRIAIETLLKSPVLILKTLANQIMSQQDYEETIRIGAIEALGWLADQQIEEKLNTIRKNESDEDISKAAYRALRRSQRTRSKQNALS